MKKRLVISASSTEKVEQLLNEHHYSTTYQIVEGKVMYGTPLGENTNLVFSVKKGRYQVHQIIK